MTRPRPLAYFLTWTTYGTWLPGDERGWVERGSLGIRTPDEAREAEAAGAMAESPFRLNPEQRSAVAEIVRRHCEIRGWTLHALAVRSNHVHAVVTADTHTPEHVLRELKSWGTRRLRPLVPGRERFWTYHGSTKWINDPEYLENAVRYVEEGQ